MWDTRKHATFAEFVASLDTGELWEQLSSLHSYFDSCHESGQGINTKEVAWERGFIEALRNRGQRATYWN